MESCSESSHVLIFFGIKSSWHTGAKVWGRELRRTCVLCEIHGSWPSVAAFFGVLVDSFSSMCMPCIPCMLSWCACPKGAWPTFPRHRCVLEMIVATSKCGTLLLELFSGFWLHTRTVCFSDVANVIDIQGHLHIDMLRKITKHISFLSKAYWPWCSCQISRHFQGHGHNALLKQRAHDVLSFLIFVLP